MLHNTHTQMTVSSFTPEFAKMLSSQKLPESHPGSSIQLNGAGIITIINIKSSGEKLVLASGKLNPAHNNFENSLALGGGFRFLKGGIEQNTFVSAITASIQFKAPAYPALEVSQLAPVAVVGYCKPWGDMQYATLHRFIDVETTAEAIELVKKMNEANKAAGKTDVFGLYQLAEVLKSAELTHQLAEDNKAKGDAIEAAGLVVTDLVSGEKRPRFIIFDDLATAALDQLILKPKATDRFDVSVAARNSGLAGNLMAPQASKDVETKEVKTTPTFSK
jgi:hypothetical protein